MLEQPKLLRRPLPPKLLPPLPPSTNRQNNIKEITPWVKQPIEKISSSDDNTEKERKVHILDYAPTFPISEKRKSKQVGSTSQQAPTPPVSVITTSLCEAKERKLSHVSLRKNVSDQNEEKLILEPTSPVNKDARAYDAHLLQLMDNVPPYQLSSQFTLDDLISKSADHTFVKENIQKPLISRYNYNILVKRLRDELGKNKQSKVNEVHITFDNIKETSARFPWRQFLLGNKTTHAEQKTRPLYITEDKDQLKTVAASKATFDGKKRKFEPSEPKINTIYMSEDYTKLDMIKTVADPEKRKIRYAGKKTKRIGLSEEIDKIDILQGSKIDFKTDKSKLDHHGLTVKITDLAQDSVTVITTNQSKYDFDTESRREESFEEDNSLSILEGKNLRVTSSTNLQIEAKKSMEFITPAEMALLKSLLHGGLALSLKAYFLEKLPDLSPLYSYLLYLNLSFNDLLHFPKEVYNIENLQVLKLRNNPIKEIPPDIYRLRNLRTFVISFCLISSLPPGLFFLQYLQFLDISYNSIPFIPNEICNLRSLDFLNVEGNELPALPCGALKLQLKQIRVGNNFMHPLLWKENSSIQPQRLTALTALFFSKNNLWQYYNELPREAEQTLNNFTECDCCKGPRYGDGIRIIRPCEKIFGVCKLPFMFCACSSSCYKNFMSQTSSLTGRLYAD